MDWYHFFESSIIGKVISMLLLTPIVCGHPVSSLMLLHWAQMRKMLEHNKSTNQDQK